MNPVLGALPPENFAWQIGKTANTIKFVKEAEEYLSHTPNQKLEEAVIEFKTQPKLQVRENISVEDWIKLNS